MIEGLQAYNIFTALNLHFKTDYDYFKYNGKTRTISESKLTNRSDYNHFRRIERRYKDKLEEFIVANMISTDTIKWVGDLVTAESELRYESWKARQARIVDDFKVQLDSMIHRDGLSINQIIACDYRKLPEMLRYYIGKKITIECVMAMNHALSGQMFKRWNNLIEDVIIWPQYQRLFTKYEPFFSADRPALIKIVKDEIILDKNMK